MRIETLAVHAGLRVDPTTGAVVPPLHMATTFEHEPDSTAPRGYLYSRNANPNRNALEECLAELEGGAAAAAFASASAATHRQRRARPAGVPQAGRRPPGARRRSGRAGRAGAGISPDLGNGIPRIDDGPWPAFPADLMSVALVTTQSSGTVLFHEKMYESRLFFVDRLIGVGRARGALRSAPGARALPRVAWLASDDCTFTTGAVHDLSGGRATY